MTITKQYIGFAVLIALATLAISLTIINSANASAGFLAANMASSSAVSVSTSPSIPVFATSSPNCAARIISTASSSIMIQFTEKFGGSPNVAKGFWQAASTTKEYDSSLYGCGAVQIFSFTTQQITVAETF